MNHLGFTPTCDLDAHMVMRVPSLSDLQLYCMVSTTPATHKAVVTVAEVSAIKHCEQSKKGGCLTTKNHYTPIGTSLTPPPPSFDALLHKRVHLTVCASSHLLFILIFKWIIFRVFIWHWIEASFNLMFVITAVDWMFESPHPKWLCWNSDPSVIVFLVGP